MQFATACIQRSRDQPSATYLESWSDNVGSRRARATARDNVEDGGLLNQSDY